MSSSSPRTEEVLSTLRLHRGDARPDSDVDVWVRLDPLSPYGLVHLKQELETLLSTSVDVVRMAPGLLRSENPQRLLLAVTRPDVHPARKTGLAVGGPHLVIDR